MSAKIQMFGLDGLERFVADLNKQGRTDRVIQLPNEVLPGGVFRTGADGGSAAPDARQGMPGRPHTRPNAFGNCTPLGSAGPAGVPISDPRGGAGCSNPDRVCFGVYAFNRDVAADEVLETEYLAEQWFRPDYMFYTGTASALFITDVKYGTRTPFDQNAAAQNDNLAGVDPDFWTVTNDQPKDLSLPAFDQTNKLIVELSERVSAIAEFSGWWVGPMLHKGG